LKDLSKRFCSGTESCKKEGGKIFSGRLIRYNFRNEKETGAEMFTAICFWDSYWQHATMTHFRKLVY